MTATFSACSAGAEELPAVEPELAAGVEDEPEPPQPASRVSAMVSTSIMLSSFFIVYLLKILFAFVCAGPCARCIRPL